MMIESRHDAEASPPFAEPVEFSDGTFVVDAAVIAQLLRVPAARVQALMRKGEITSACERGVDEHEGEFRLTFFYGNRRARLATDTTGRILRRSVIDFGDRPVASPQAPQGR